MNSVRFLLSLLFVLSVFNYTVSPAHAEPRAEGVYAVAQLPTPVFNMAQFRGLFGGKDGMTLLTDQCRQIRQLEFVALPQTVFKVEAILDGGSAAIYRVSTTDYPYPTTTGYFVDARFVRLAYAKPPERRRILPSRQVIIERLLKAQGSIYVWGGNVREGIPSMFELYPPAAVKALPSETALRWELSGVDCSGLLYEAADGVTPRNTSALVNYGKSVPVSGLTDEQIVRQVEPLDLIVWNGHVLIILDRERVIESYLNCTKGGGVRVRPLSEALAEIRKKRMPLDAWPDDREKQRSGFVIRRWYDGVASKGQHSA